MLDGVYDLTDNRDFIKDIPGNVMKGINPRTLFESPKDYYKFNNEKSSYEYLNIRSSNTTYNLTHTSGQNSYITITDQYGYIERINYSYNFDNITRSISWTSDADDVLRYYNYDVDNIKWKSLYYDIISDKDVLKPKLAKLPWNRNRHKDNYTNNSNIRIADCSIHGRYISWKMIGKKGCMHYQPCPKCEARKDDYYKSKEGIYPWNTDPKPEDMKHKQKRPSHIPIDYKVHHYLIMLPRSISKSIRDNMNLKIREHNVPWANTELRELEKVVEYYINENYYDKRIPWFKNMSRPAFLDYWEENIIEHEDTEHANENPDIIDTDEKEMERYLNMRPGVNGGNMWH